MESMALVYGEHGAESIHKIFRLWEITYCSIQPAIIRLPSMQKEHYRLGQPDPNVLKTTTLKRKRHRQGENSVLP